MPLQSAMPGEQSIKTALMNCCAGFLSRFIETERLIGSIRSVTWVYKGHLEVV
jgi:hypothetical protein